MNKTVSEIAREEGAVNERLLLVKAQLEHRFGALSSQARQRLERMSPDELQDVAFKLLTAESLTELGLQESTDE